MLGSPISQKGKFVGAVTYGANVFVLAKFESDGDNAEYRRFFKEHFNLATIPFYWDSLEPEEGKPRYDKNSKKVYRRPPDRCINYCKENEKQYENCVRNLIRVFAIPNQ